FAGFESKPVEFNSIVANAESAYNIVARAAGLECRYDGGQILLVKRSSERLALDAELATKLATPVSVNFTNIPVAEAVAPLSAITHISLDPSTFQRDEANPQTKITLHLRDIAGRNAIYWLCVRAAIRFADLNCGDLVEVGAGIGARDANREEAIRA